MASLATVEQLAIWPGIMIDLEDENEVAAAQAVLDAASAYIRVESSDPNRWTVGIDDAPSVIPDAAQVVCVQVAARVWRNPSCATFLVTGPFSEQFHRAIDDAVFLTDMEQKTIGALVARPKVWTLPTTRDGDLDMPGGFDCFSGEIVPPSEPPDPMFLLYGGGA